jgi:hypothetical protein
MAFDVMGRRAYLRRLRERAMERMRVDELAVAVPEAAKPVSRRDSLRWLGMAAVASVAGTRPLRALAENANGLLAERAAGVGSSRYPAPQYGVPAMAQPSVPYEEGNHAPTLWGGAVQTARTRGELGEPERWVRDGVQVIPGDGGAGFPGGEQRVKAWVIFYAGPWEHPHALQVVVNWNTNRAYVASGGQYFYVEEDGQLWGFLIRGKQLFLRKSFYGKKVSGAAEDELTAALHGFLQEVSDVELLAEEKTTAVIDLSGVVKGDGTGDPMITSVSAKQGRVTVLSGWSAYNFTVDLKTKKLILPGNDAK